MHAANNFNFDLTVICRQLKEWKKTIESSHTQKLITEMHSRYSSQTASLCIFVSYHFAFRSLLYYYRWWPSKIIWIIIFCFWFLLSLQKAHTHTHILNSIDAVDLKKKIPSIKYMKVTNHCWLMSFTELCYGKFTVSTLPAPKGHSKFSSVNSVCMQNQF